MTPGQEARRAQVKRGETVLGKRTALVREAAIRQEDSDVAFEPNPVISRRPAMLRSMYLAYRIEPMPVNRGSLQL